jgi:hypothetical protein
MSNFRNLIEIYNNPRQNSPRILTPPVAGNSRVGSIPFFISVVIGFGLAIGLMLLLFKFETAKQLALYDFDQVDPVFTTYLIFIYGFLCSAIFVHHLKTDPRTDTRNGKYTLPLIPKVLYPANLILTFFPSMYWLLILTFNSPLNHPYSIIINILLIVYLAMLFFNINNHFKKIDPKKSLLSFVFNIDEFRVINIFLAFIILIIFSYFFAIYETDSLTNIINIFKNGKDNLAKHILLALSIFFLTFIYHQWPQIYGLIGNWFYLILVLVMFCSIGLITIGSIPALDVLLLFIIVLRVIIFECSEILKLLYIFLFQNHYHGLRKALSTPLTRRQQVTVASSIFLLSLYLFNTMAGDEKIYQSKYTMTMNDLPKYNQRANLSEAITNWIKTSKDTTPIFLIAGQGGGSRAGCAMYNMLSLLDSSGLANNILAITSISGSSTGTQFFLASKYHKTKSTLSILSRADTLYNRDYVTKSMYKMLFTDRYAFLKLFNSFENRNENLINLESEGFSLISPIGKKLKDMIWPDWYSSSKPDLPIFLPMTYNASVGKQTVSSPYVFDVEGKRKYFSILDSLATKNKATLSISKSVALSQMFPFISASAIIDTNNFIDGGVYDNGSMETLDELYKLTNRLRTSMNSTRKIVLLSVENGRVENEPKKYSSQISSIQAAAVNSIFTSNPVNHLENIKIDKSRKDTIIRLFVYNTNKKDPPKYNLVERLANYVQIKEDSSLVVLSRYLTQDEVERIHLFAKREYEKIKYLLKLP